MQPSEWQENNFLGMIYVLHSLEKERDLKNALEKKTGNWKN